MKKNTRVKLQESPKISLSRNNVLKPGEQWGEAEFATWKYAFWDIILASDF